MKDSNYEKRLQSLMYSFSPGRVFKVQEFSRFSSAPSRDLKALVLRGYLVNLGRGFYYRPKKLGAYNVPPSEKELLLRFLKTSHFLIRNMSDFNKLRLGTTQLFNETYIYNKKRDGKIELGGTTFFFKKRDFPKTNHDEYMLVDMLNNLDRLGVNNEEVLSNLRRRWNTDLPLDKSTVLKFSKKYGKYWVKKYFEKIEGDI